MRRFGFLRGLARRLRRTDERVTLRVAGVRCEFLVGCDVERFRTVDFGGEREQVAEFIESLIVSDVVYDVGASVGLYSILAAKVAGSVVAFEPDPGVVERLHQNVNLNDSQNVHVQCCALGAQHGRRTLYSDGVEGYAPSFLRQDRRGAPEGVVDVAVLTLDELVETGEFPVPTILKIDVEGAEAEVLAGASGLLCGVLALPPRAIWLELHPGFLEKLNSSTSQVESLLTACGYREVWSRARGDEIHRLYQPRPTAVAVR